MNEELFSELERLGFSVNESKVYMTLIHLGPALAGVVSKTAHLDRSSTYNALNSLLKKGLVSTVYENKRTTFVPENPKRIIDYFSEKQEIARNIIPKITEEFQYKKKTSAVKLYQGYKGLKTVFQDIIDSCDPNDSYYVVGSEGNFDERMPHYAPLFKNLKEEKKIKAKIFVRSDRKLNSKSKYSDYRAVPSDVESPATINVYKDKVSIMIWDTPPQAIFIENENVARTLKNYFDFMWKSAKVINTKSKDD